MSSELQQLESKGVLILKYIFLANFHSLRKVVGSR